MWREGRLDLRMPSKNWKGTCNAYNLKWLQKGPYSAGLHDLRFKVRAWMLNTISRLAVTIWHPVYHDQSHELYQSGTWQGTAIEIDIKFRLFSLSR